MKHFDRVQRYCDGFRDKLGDCEEIRPSPVGKKRTKIVAISDLHVPFCREDLVKEIAKKHSGADECVVTGDLFDCNLISVFPKEKEIPFAIEYAAVFELVYALSQNFGKVTLVDGNHDFGRFAREMGKINPTIKFLVKESPLKYVAEGRSFSPQGEDQGTISLPNVFYAGESGPSWWHRVGKTIFAHRLRGFRKAPMANAAHVADWFINRGTDFQCLVSAHSHRVGMIPYRGGRILIDQGALCYPMAYEVDGGCNLPPMDLGYAIVEMDSKGNVDPVATGPVYLGTYQEV